MVRNANKVPYPSPMFWTIKVLTTAFGEALSDFLVGHLDPAPTVVVTAVVFVVVLVAQLRSARYIPWLYWAAVVMVGVFGTMVADVLHVALGLPYAATAIGFLVVLVAVFVVWQRTERTIDVHRIDTRRRELFYWAAVCATFALGTAAGDLTASVFGLGYLVSALVFAAVIAIVAILRGVRVLGPVSAFWIAYVLTRPVGASFADWGGRSPATGGIGLGTGTVSAVLAVAIVVLVAVQSVRHVRAARVSELDALV